MCFIHIGDGVFAEKAGRLLALNDRIACIYAIFYVGEGDNNSVHSHCKNQEPYVCCVCSCMRTRRKSAQYQIQWQLNNNIAKKINVKSFILNHL